MTDLNTPRSIPTELRPAIQRIARRLLEQRGFQVPDGYMFSATAKHPREREAFNGAVLALEALQEHCVDWFGTDLSMLVNPNQ